MVQRIIRAPVRRVFRAWSDQNILSLWWGPKNSKNTFHTFQFKPGGLWTFVSEASNGSHQVRQAIFAEIVDEKRILIDFQGQNPGRVTVEFDQISIDDNDLKSENAVATRLFINSEPFTVAEITETLDRLDAQVEKMR